MTELLIVDDDRSIRRMLERTLTAEGYQRPRTRLPRLWEGVESSWPAA
jgi:DNA-binding response OmpR family regulator